MTLDDKITFCKFCTNREFGSEKGLICKLTYEKPNFLKRCENFIEDKEELLDARNGSKTYRLKNNSNQIFYLFTNYYSEEINIDTKKTIKVKCALYKNYLLIISSIGIIGFSYFFIKSGIDKNSIASIVITMSMLFIMFGFSIIKLINNKSIFTLSPTGITIEEKATFKWSEIVRFYYEKQIQENNILYNYKLFVFEVFGKKEKIVVEVGELHRIRKVGLMIEKYRKNYA